MYNVNANRHKHILIAEDSAITQDIMQLALGKNGHHICAAGLARDAVALLLEQNFDIALIDFNLPDRNGLELVKEYLAKNTKDTIPRLVALTGDSNEVYKMDQKGQYFDLIMAKPFLISDLLAVVEAPESVMRPVELKARFSGRNISAPTPALPHNSPFHLIYFPYDFYASYKNAVSMSVARNGPADALIFDTVPTAQEAQMLCQIKGLGVAAHIDRTQKMPFQCDLSIDPNTSYSGLGQYLEKRRSARKSFHPNKYACKDLHTNLLISTALKDKPLQPRIDLSAPTGMSYNHILDASDILKVGDELSEKSYFEERWDEPIFRCPYCESARIYPRQLPTSDEPSTLEFICTDCSQEFAYTQLSTDSMLSFVPSDQGLEMLKNGDDCERH